MDIEGKRVAALVGDGFEESELFEPKRALEDAGAIVTIVGAGEKALQKIRGKKGLDEGQSVKAEELVADVTADDFDALLIPGGMSPDHIRTNKDVQRFVKDFDAAKKPMFVICHGPQVLISAQVVRGRTLTGLRRHCRRHPQCRRALSRSADRDRRELGHLSASRRHPDVQSRHARETREHRNGASIAAGLSFAEPVAFGAARRAAGSRRISDI